MTGKEGRLVVSGEPFALNNLGKWLMTNSNGLCAECCGKPTSCTLSLCGPLRDSATFGGTSQPITIDGLPWADHSFGYAADCDELLKLNAMQDFGFKYEYEETFTQYSLECNTNGTITATVKINYNDDEGIWQTDPYEHRRRNKNAWPLYKLTPTYDNATGRFTVELGWYNQPEKLYVRFEGTSSINSISYVGDGTPTVVGNVLELTDLPVEGGTGTWIVEPASNWRAFAIYFYQNPRAIYTESIWSLWYRRRSFSEYGSDTATITLNAHDGKCLICSLYELIEVTFNVGDCTQVWQLAATKNTRPWYWCGCTTINSIKRGFAVTDHTVADFQNEEMYTLQKNEKVLNPAIENDPNYVDGGPGHPLTTLVTNKPQDQVPIFRFGQPAGYFKEYQSQTQLQHGNGLEFWRLQNPVGIKTQIYNYPYTTYFRDNRSGVVNNEWATPQVPAQNRYKPALHNNVKDWWMFDGLRMDGDLRSTVKFEDNWPEDKHPAERARRTTVAFGFEPGPDFAQWKSDRPAMANIDPSWGYWFSMSLCGVKFYIDWLYSRGSEPNSNPNLGATHYGEFAIKVGGLTLWNYNPIEILGWPYGAVPHLFEWEIYEPALTDLTSNDIDGYHDTVQYKFVMDGVDQVNGTFADIKAAEAIDPFSVFPSWQGEWATGREGSFTGITGPKPCRNISSGGAAGFGLLRDDANYIAFQYGGYITEQDWHRVDFETNGAPPEFCNNWRKLITITQCDVKTEYE